MPLCDSIFLCFGYIALLTVYAMMSEAVKKGIRKQRKKKNVRLVYSRTVKNELNHNDELSEEAV